MRKRKRLCCVLEDFREMVPIVYPCSSSQRKQGNCQLFLVTCLLTFSIFMANSKIIYIKILPKKALSLFQKNFWRSANNGFLDFIATQAISLKRNRPGSKFLLNKKAGRRLFIVLQSYSIEELHNLKLSCII